jgi:hypothetical protein
MNELFTGANQQAKKTGRGADKWMPGKYGL